MSTEKDIIDIQDRYAIITESDIDDEIVQSDLVIHERQHLYKSLYDDLTLISYVIVILSVLVLIISLIFMPVVGKICFSIILSLIILWFIFKGQGFLKLSKDEKRKEREYALHLDSAELYDVYTMGENPMSNVYITDDVLVMYNPIDGFSSVALKQIVMGYLETMILVSMFAFIPVNILTIVDRQRNEYKIVSVSMSGLHRLMEKTALAKVI